MGSLIAPTALTSQNGLAARTVMRPVSSPVLASQDPVPMFVTAIPHVLTCGMSGSPLAKLTMPPVLVTHAKMVVDVFLCIRYVTLSWTVIVVRMSMNTNVR